jgi:putative FmdB family regulatory protein
MPFYEYECANCKFYTEVLQKITDAPLTKCPSCSKEALKKLVSAPIFRLKGGGWYETDFKGDKESKRNLAGSDGEESAKTETTSESSTADSSKSEAPKAEPSKPEAVTTKSPSKVAASKSATSGSGSTSKAGSGKLGSGKRTSTGRTAKPAGKVAASKARPAAAVRSKGKPATKTGARKKARR